MSQHANIQPTANSHRKSERGKRKQQLLHCLMMMAADGWHIYYGRDGEVIPRHVTRVRIDESLTAIPAQAFHGNRTIEELDCHDGVKTVGEMALHCCPSLRKVIMPGVEVVQQCAFMSCKALADVECGELEIIGRRAFDGCKSLRIINLPSAKIVKRYAFCDCPVLMNVKFGKELESIGRTAFGYCTSLERITIPLKDDMITNDDIFQRCDKLKHVDLVEGEQLHDTIAALLLEEWKNDMKDDVDAINQSLPTTPAGDFNDVGGKAQAIRMWIRLVLHKIIYYKAHHQLLLNEAASALQLALPQDDVVMNNVLPFLELPNMNMQR